MNLRRIWLCALLIATTMGVTNAWSQKQRSHIPRQQIEQMFSQMRAGAPWNVDGPLLWGYFFTDDDRAALERASAMLQQQGYRFVGIRRDAQNLWWLHVEKVERHTVDSLDERNAVLDAFAAERQVAYDGMDVGPAS